MDSQEKLRKGRLDGTDGWVEAPRSYRSWSPDWEEDMDICEAL